MCIKENNDIYFFKPAELYVSIDIVEEIGLSSKVLSWFMIEGKKSEQMI